MVVAVQLGSGANFDMGLSATGSSARCCDTRRSSSSKRFRPITPEVQAFTPLSDRHRQVSLFPSFRYSLAFDAAVSARATNAFHEQVLGAIPTLFVPNEAAT